MLSLTWMIPVFPLLGFLVLAFVGRRLPTGAVAATGVGSVALAFLLATGVIWSFLTSPPAGREFSQSLWTWFSVAGLSPHIAVRLDPLSVVWVAVVALVGLLIHIYSTEFMSGDEDYSRFFAYLNLFIGSMLILVLADDLLLLFLGWEGVGLCSYLLIGFWYRDADNAKAAMKAFFTTRVGDAAFALGVFLLATRLGTLAIPAILTRAQGAWATGSTIAVVAAALLLAGALGKSAQLPLQVWLPDAMAGPTPVSALIHAATMVTAGVYLIARFYPLFALAPQVLTVIAIIGAVTLIIAGTSALAQRNIKRVAAYSTVSQLGYMFLALGVGAIPAAVFHFVTHAFFKALLFLGSGAVIHAMDGEHDMFKMGGLRKRLPVTFWTFVVGAASLSALPLVTAGFYSKDFILYEAYISPRGSVWLWLAGLIGAVLTSLYASRMVILTFFGPITHEPHKRPGLRMLGPMVVLATLSVAAGALETPVYIGGIRFLTHFLSPMFSALPQGPIEGLGPEIALALAAGTASIGGILIAAWVWGVKRESLARLVATPSGDALLNFLAAGWRFDALYAAVVVRPYVWLANIDRADILDAPWRGIAALATFTHAALSRLQTGRLRTYAMAIGIGIVVLVAVVVWR